MLSGTRSIRNLIAGTLTQPERGKLSARYRFIEIATKNAKILDPLF